MQLIWTPAQTRLFILLALGIALPGPAAGYDAMPLPTALKQHDLVLVAKVVRRASGKVSLAPELILKGELARKEFDLSETWNPGKFWVPQTLLERKRYLLLLHRDEAGRPAYSKHPVAESVREVDSVDDAQVRTAVVTLRLLDAPDAAARTQALEKGWIEESDAVKQRILQELMQLGADDATVPYLIRCMEAGAERSGLMEMAATLIGRFQYRQTIPTLLKVLQKDHWSSIYPAQALGKLKVRDAYQPLMDRIESPIAGNRVYFIEALCELDDERSIPFLIETARRNLPGLDPAAGTYRSSDIRENELAVACLGRLRARQAALVLKQVAEQRTHAKLRQLAEEALLAIEKSRE